MSEPTVQALLVAGRQRLEAAGIDGAERDARWLMGHALDCDAGRVLVHLHDAATPEQTTRFEAAITARASGRPVSQITGVRQFFGRPFHISADVLDPRPETETLIAEALSAPFAEVLDLGTGSGCILATLLAERTGATGTGTDISAAALRIAAQNLALHGLTDRATLLRSDWLAQVTGAYDLIVSNPPYISDAAFAALAPDVAQHEPKIALTPGGDGLAAYRVLTRDAPAHLRPGGRLLLEIGYDQGLAVTTLCKQARLADIRVLRDLDGRDRVVTAIHPAGA